MLRLVIAALLVVLCAAPVAVGGEVAKVSVLASGDLLLDGQPTTLPALEERFKALEAAGGAVWYHRENATAEPPPQGTAVIKLVVKYRLPISMSLRADFSDWVDGQGVSHPRAR